MKNHHNELLKQCRAANSACPDNCRHKHIHYCNPVTGFETWRCHTGGDVLAGCIPAYCITVDGELEVIRVSPDRCVALTPQYVYDELNATVYH